MLWLLTFVTHNARVSERMKEYKVRRGNPVVLTSQEQVRVAEAILDAAERHHIAVSALNVLPAHVHLIIAAESEGVLAENVRKLKGYSAHLFRKSHPSTTDTKLWAPKFNRRPLRDESALTSATHYVYQNHLKHAQQWGEALIETCEQHIRPLVDSRCVPIAEIFGDSTARG